jgi:hypothetical protein
MTPVHAVEIPDRQHRAAEPLDLWAIVTDHHERLLSFGLRHGKRGWIVDAHRVGPPPPQVKRRSLAGG